LGNSPLIFAVEQTESDPMVRRVAVDELLGLFGRSLLMVTPFMVWHDLEFEVIAHHKILSMKLIIIG
jgi:hypothetical protein